MSAKSKYSILTILPILGILVYVLFFFISERMYGGGSEEYHFWDQLFCDLMEQVTHHGQVNNARTMAIIGNTFLFVGMTAFFYLIPLDFKEKNFNLKLVKVLGMVAMANFLFLFTQYHDLVVLITGVLGFFVISFLIWEYVDQGSFAKYWFEITCLILSIMVFISFQFKIGIDHLPVFQKMVFVLDSIWVLTTCTRIRRTVLVPIN